MTASRNPEYFERKYQADPDPWKFRQSRYEQEKYAETLHMLAGRQFCSALEIGCSIGVLTAMLAPQCGRLLAVDVSDTALASARTHCAGLPQVAFENRQIPAQWPGDQKYDLILVSEILYFFSPDDIAATARRATECLVPGGLILLVNFTDAIDEPCNGEDAAKIFAAAAPRLNTATLRRPRYRMDLLARPLG